MKKKIYLMSGILFLGLIVLSLIFKQYGVDTAQLYIQDCNLQEKPCTVLMPYGKEITFELSPRPVIMNQRIYTIVDANKHSLDTIQLDLKGIEMDMGYNRPILKDVENKHLFKQQIYMPACTSDYMHWQLTYLINFQQKEYSVVFKIKTEKE